MPKGSEKLYRKAAGWNALFGEVKQAREVCNPEACLIPTPMELEVNAKATPLQVAGNWKVVAAISVYPELTCKGVRKPIRTTYGVSDELLCAGNEFTYEFLGNVFKELADVFPAEYIPWEGFLTRLKPTVKDMMRRGITFSMEY